MEGLNLAFYIGIGFLQQNGLVVAAIILSLVVLYAIIAVLKLTKIDQQTLGLTAIGGLVLWVFFILSLPALTNSSLAQVEYITDWVMLFFISFSYAFIGLLLLYPILRLVKFYRPALFDKIKV